MHIRPATSEDFDALRKVELAAFETLRKAGAVRGPASASADQDLQRYLDHGLLYLAGNRNDAAVGFCGGYIADGFLHIGELDVHPDYQRQGLGRVLVTTLLAEGRARKLDGATLTTDRLVPFNAPFYATLGFRLIEQQNASLRLRRILETEIENGLDPLRRVAMMLEF